MVRRGRYRWSDLLLRLLLSLLLRGVLLLLDGGLLSRQLLLLLLNLHPLLSLHLRRLLRRHGDLLLLLSRHHLLMRWSGHRRVADGAIGGEGGVGVGVSLGHLDRQRLPRHAGLLHRVMRMLVRWM